MIQGIGTQQQTGAHGARDETTLNERLVELRGRLGGTIDALTHVLDRVRGPIPRGVSQEKAALNGPAESATLERSISHISTQLADLDAQVAELNRLI